MIPPSVIPEDAKLIVAEILVCSTTLGTPTDPKTQRGQHPAHLNGMGMLLGASWLQRDGSPQLRKDGRGAFTPPSRSA